jgi:hypothetical protein
LGFPFICWGFPEESGFPEGVGNSWDPVTGSIHVMALDGEVAAEYRGGVLLRDALLLALVLRGGHS